MANRARGRDNQISSADFVRQFAHYRRVAETDPVFVTNHGRETHVMMAIEAFASLSDGRGSAAGLDVTRVADEMAESLAYWTSDALVMCDRQLKIIFMNRVAEAKCQAIASSSVGRNLREVLPAIVHTLFDLQLLRTERDNEPTMSDVPSPFTEGSWLHLRTYPWRDRIVVGFRDITEDVMRHRVADVESALVEAMSIHGGVGYAVLSVRGTIDRTNRALAQMVELPEDRLVGLPIVNLIDSYDRTSFRASFEAVMRGEQSLHQRVGLAGNKETVDVTCTQLKGAYGGEGAVAMFTHASANQS